MKKHGITSPVVELAIEEASRKAQNAEGIVWPRKQCGCMFAKSTARDFPARAASRRNFLDSLDTAMPPCIKTAYFE